MKRQNVISWDEFFMGVAKLASLRSKDPDTQCGACIVDPKTNRIVSVGYNGLPRGLDDNGVNILHENHPEEFLILGCKDSTLYDYWSRPNKYEFSVHAEENAILNCNEDLTNCVIYVYCDKGYYPCSRCARDIIQKGIKEVVMAFAIEVNTAVYNWEFTKHMFTKANVQIRILKQKEIK
jgi:dCMP deaminase